MNRYHWLRVLSGFISFSLHDHWVVHCLCYTSHIVCGGRFTTRHLEVQMSCFSARLRDDCP